MKMHMSRRLFLPAAVLGGVAVFAAVFFVALAVHSVVADPGGPVPNPGHAWTEIQDHGIDGGDYWLGTIDMQALELRVNNERALRLEPNNNVIGGYSGNAATDGAGGAAIGGGGEPGLPNRVTDQFGTVGGGGDNRAGDDDGDNGTAEYATVGGGGSNTASGSQATVGGGANSTASGDNATVGGGFDNQASAILATVGGGEHNTASAHDATVGGGDTNTASGDSATVGGGVGNTASAETATVGGGQHNEASGPVTTIGGGDGNLASAPWATVGGGFDNQATASCATISGGCRSDPEDGSTANRVTDDYGTVGGGGNNQAGYDDGDTTNQTYATVGGGQDNSAQDDHATVGGGWGNIAGAESATVAGGAGNIANNGYATVGGGVSNTADYEYATVGGGESNAASGSYATIAGGGPSDPGDPATSNRSTDDYGSIGGGGNNQAGDADPDSGNSPYATVGGGFSNTASGHQAAVGGGGDNVASTNNATVGGGWSNEATNHRATVGGGFDNAAGGWSATVPGGESNNAQGDYSFAAGYRAKVDGAHGGTFLFADANDFDFDSAAANEFAVRATGGSRIVTGIDGSGIPDAGVKLDPDDNAWEVLSDRDAKENFVVLDTQDVLNRLAGIPITEWNYKTQDPSNRHIGPMAQDFYAAFGLSADELYISPIDTDGVALAAIQGLYELSQEQDARIDALEARVAALEGGAPLERGSESLLSSIMPFGPLFFAGLFVGGLVLVQRRRAGGRS